MSLAKRGVEHHVYSHSREGLKPNLASCSREPPRRRDKHHTVLKAMDFMGFYTSFGEGSSVPGLDCAARKTTLPCRQYSSGRVIVLPIIQDSDQHLSYSLNS